MEWKKFGKALLFPHAAIRIALVPAAGVLLVYSMTSVGIHSPAGILACVLATYALTVWCVKIPALIHWFRTLKLENKYAIRWRDDARFRVNVSLCIALIWNTAYALLQLGMGFRHHTFWFFSLAGYYISLVVMRLFLVRHTWKYRAGERMAKELRIYRACGIAFLAMNLALALMIFFMVYWNRTFEHSMITAIAMAAYTFWSFTHAIVGIVKYRKYNSPILSASKAISMAAACVSMLTLESTMLTTFGDGTMDLAARRIMLTATGAAVSVVVIITAVYMIARGTREIKKEKRNAKQR